MSKLSKLLIAVLTCEGVGLVSTPFTIAAIQNWYRYLNKPPFSPSNWVFGPVWTILYFMMGVSAYLIWVNGLKNRNVKIALMYFLSQLFLNFLWSILFFGLQSPLLALFDIILLWVMIVLTILKFNPISKLASYLLIPYLLWVSFASILNFSIFILNP